MTLPVHMRRRNGTPVEVVAQGRKFGPNSPASVIYLYVSNGYTYIGYAMADGTNPNNARDSDLLPYNTTRVAQFVQIDLDPPMFQCLKLLWRTYEQWGPVVDVIHGLDPSLEKADIRHYLTTLWGI